MKQGFFLAAFLISLVIPCNAQITGLQLGNKAPEITMQNPEGVLLNLKEWQGKLVLIDFWASWCGPCKALAPILERVDNKLRESNSDVKVYKYNIENDAKLVTSLGVRAVPTIKFFSGGENTKTNVGMMTEVALLESASIL